MAKLTMLHWTLSCCLELRAQRHEDWSSTRPGSRPQGHWARMRDGVRSNTRETNMLLEVIMVKLLDSNPGCQHNLKHKEIKSTVCKSYHRWHWTRFRSRVYIFVAPRFIVRECIKCCCRVTLRNINPGSCYLLRRITRNTAAASLSMSNINFHLSVKTNINQSKLFKEDFFQDSACSLQHWSIVSKIVFISHSCFTKHRVKQHFSSAFSDCCNLLLRKIGKIFATTKP